MSYESTKRNLNKFISDKDIKLKEIEFFKLDKPIKNVVDMGFVMIGFQYVSTLSNEVFTHDLEVPLLYDPDNDLIIIDQKFTSGGFRDDTKKYLPKEISDYVRTYQGQSSTTKTGTSKRVNNKTKNNT